MRHVHPLLWFTGWLGAIGLLAGCSTEPPAVETGKIASTATPREILDQVLATYRGMTSYSDTARARLSYRVDGQPLEEVTELASDVVRPNQVRFHVQRPRLALTIASNGQRLWAVPKDPATKDFDGQYVDRPAPEALSLADLYAATEYTDPIRPQLMVSLLEGTHLRLDDLPIALLLSEKPLDPLLNGPVKLTRLPDQELDGRFCARVLAATEAGDETLWIDRDSLLLRRIELPTQKIAQELTSQPEHQGQLTELALTIDILDPRPGATIDAARFAAPQSAAPAQKYFVLPPTELPSHLFGKVPAEFQLVDLAQKPISQQSLQGQICVLMWFNDHPTCQKAMVALDGVYQLYKARPQVRFLGVCTEPPTLNSGHVGAIVRGWKTGVDPRGNPRGVEVPIARDFKAVGRDIFRIEQAPTMVVLDAAGAVQIFEVGHNPRLAQELPVVLERLLAGDNLAVELLERQKQEQIQYLRQLAVARGKPLAEAPAETPVAEVPKILPRSAPLKLKLEPRWKCADVAQPGNLLVVDEAGGPVLYCLSAGRKVARINAAGKVVATFDLKLPPDVRASFLRTGVDGQGKRFFAAGHRLGASLFVFDAEWKPILSYPDAEQKHDGIQDSRLLDLDDDGQLDLVIGFWGLVGVHRVGLDGKRVWGNRVASSILSVTPFLPPGGKRQVLIANDRGLLVPIDAGGRDEQAYQVGTRAIHQLTGSASAASKWTGFLGLSYLPDGGILAVAMNEKLEEKWSYPLPTGQYATLIEPVVSGQLLPAGDSSGQWVLAGTDHSLHILSEDGNLADFFYYGQVLHGLAIAGSGSEASLVVATADGLEAWSVKP